MKFSERTWGFDALGWHWAVAVGNAHGVLLGVTADVSRDAVVLAAHCAGWSIELAAIKVTNREN